MPCREDASSWGAQVGAPHSRQPHHPLLRRAQPQAMLDARTTGSWWKLVGGTMSHTGLRGRLCPRGLLTITQSPDPGPLPDLTKYRKQL